MKKTILFMFIAVIFFGVMGCQQTGQLPEILKIADRSPALDATNLSGTETLSVSFNFQIYHTINYLLSQESITIDNLFTEILGYGPNHTAGDHDLSSAVLSWSQDSKTMIISGIGGWTGGASSVIEIVPREGKLMDVFDNTLRTSTVIWRFTLSSDPVTPTTTTTTTTQHPLAPQVSSAAPANGSTGTGRTGALITATFDKNMDASTINTSNIKVSSALGSVDGSVSYAAGTKTASFTPTNYLAYGVAYTVTIEGTVKDQAGIQMGTPYSWGFTTKTISFATETVDNTGTVTGNTSIAIGSTNIAYQHANTNLRYAVGDFGSWTASTIESGNVGGNNSIAVDSVGKIHISYRKGTGGEDLKYATNSSGSWQTETVDAGGSVGFSSSIGVDSGGVIHIAYNDSTNTSLKYATGNFGSWSVSTIDGGLNVGSDCYLALDSNGKVHIAYLDSSANDIKYINNVSGSWSIPQFIGDSAAGSFRDICLAMDSNAKAYISYYRKSDELRYATNASGSWIKTILDSGDVGEFPSIVVDANKGIHISYYDTGNKNLKYAYNISGTWQFITPDSGGDVGRDSAMAVDSQGKLNISYKNSDAGSLKYAVSQ
jgi:hypothetical protein